MLSERWSVLRHLRRGLRTNLCVRQQQSKMSKQSLVTRPNGPLVESLERRMLLSAASIIFSDPTISGGAQGVVEPEGGALFQSTNPLSQTTNPAIASASESQDGAMAGANMSVSYQITPQSIETTMTGHAVTENNNLNVIVVWGENSGVQ